MKKIISENVYNSSQKPQMLMMLENGCELKDEPADPKNPISEKDKYCNFLLMIQQDNTTDDDTKKRVDTLFSEVGFVRCLCIVNKK